MEAPFYRPLTVAFFAARFQAFGFDPGSYHRLSLVLFALCAVLVGVVVLRTARSPALATLAVALFVVHPAMPIALVAWVTNQMHLLAMLLFLLAWCWWTICRERSAVWWTPLLAFQAAILLVKEDGVMLLPTVFVLHACYRRTLDPATPPVPRPVLIAGGVTLALLVAWRQIALGHQAPRLKVPGLPQAAAHLMDGPLQVLSARYGTGLVATGVGLFAVGVGAIGLWTARSPETARPEARWAILSGAALVMLFDLPYVLVTKPYQWHFLALGAVLLLAGSIDVVAKGMTSRAGRGLFAAATLAVLVTMGHLSRALAHEWFGPWSYETIARDFEALGWGDAVAPPLRAKLERRTKRHLLWRAVPEAQRPPLAPEDR